MAVLIHPVGEVLTSDADAGAFPALKLLVIDESPRWTAEEGVGQSWEGLSGYESG